MKGCRIPTWEICHVWVKPRGWAKRSFVSKRPHPLLSAPSGKLSESCHKKHRRQVRKIEEQDMDAMETLWQHYSEAGFGKHLAVRTWGYR